MSRPDLVRTTVSLRERMAAEVSRGGRVGFVPTMGALHEGHLSLMREAAARSDLVVASVFVNPLQFGPNEDLTRYPRDLDGDLARAGVAGVHVVFAPELEEIYPPGYQTRIAVADVSRGLCGPHRPGHFGGVATVVAKLLLAVGPCLAFFGRKDFQQLRVIQRMVRDLGIDAEIIGMPIVREPDGLAMSSRNVYLSPADRERARSLSRGLVLARSLFDRGAREVTALEQAARAPIATAADSIDYVTVCDVDTLVGAPAPVVGRALLAVAARIGRTRLIDNTVLGEPWEGALPQG